MIRILTAYPISIEDTTLAKASLTEQRYTYLSTYPQNLSVDHHSAPTTQAPLPPAPAPVSRLRFCKLIGCELKKERRREKKKRKKS